MDQLTNLVTLALIAWGLFAFYKHFVQPRKAAKVVHAKAIELNEVADEMLAEEQSRLAQTRARGPIIELCVGTGRLMNERNHISGIPNGKRVFVDAELAARGIVVVGPTGSGKTRALLQKIAGYWLEFNQAGLFAFAEKANWSRILVRIAKFAGLRDDQIHIVGPGKQPWPLLRGADDQSKLSADSVANFVRTAMEMGGNRSDKFFVSSAENLVRRTANVLYATSQYGPMQITSKAENGEVIETFTLDYDLFSVSKLARMDAEVLEKWVVPEIRIAAAVLEAQGNSDAKRRIDANLPELISAASLKSEKQREGIIGTIDAVLAPFFTEAEFEEAFSGNGSFDLGVLDRGALVVLDVNKDRFPAAATLAFLLGFEQVKLYMRNRIRRLGEGADLNPVMFLADEYAQVACRDHLEMWRISREANISPVLAYQTHTDLQGAIGREVADGMMQNFATRVVFGTSDPASIALVQAGKAEVERESVSDQSSWHSGSSSSNPMGGIGSSGKSEGESGGRTSSTSWVERAVVDEQLMDSLSNKIKRSVPINEQTAEVVVRTIQGSKRVCDICVVAAWDPPALPVGKPSAV